MDRNAVTFIKIVALLALAIFTPIASYATYYYRDGLYTYWNRLDRLYRKLRRKIHV